MCIPFKLVSPKQVMEDQIQEKADKSLNGSLTTTSILKDSDAVAAAYAKTKLPAPPSAPGVFATREVPRIGMDQLRSPTQFAPQIGQPTAPTGMKSWLIKPVSGGR